MSTFENLRIDTYKILQDFDENHPLWDIGECIYKAEEHMHLLENVVEAAREYLDNHPETGTCVKCLRGLTHFEMLESSLKILDEARRNGHEHNE